MSERSPAAVLRDWFAGQPLESQKEIDVILQLEARWLLQVIGAEDLDSIPDSIPLTQLLSLRAIIDFNWERARTPWAQTSAVEWQRLRGGALSNEWLLRWYER